MNEAPAESCRLCLETVFEGGSEQERRLISPCNCRTLVHIGCLRQWQSVRLAQPARTIEEGLARAQTCEICNALLVVDGERLQPPFSSAICRAHGGLDKVALRRIPTLSRDAHVFSEFSASEGQVLELLEQDTSGEFFRVRVRTAERYRGLSDGGAVGIAEGWIRHVYLEWPDDNSGPSRIRELVPRRPPHYGTTLFVPAEATPGEAATVGAFVRTEAATTGAGIVEDDADTEGSVDMDMD